MILKPSSENGQLDVLLVKRVSSPIDPWSGHMAFPGGRQRGPREGMFETARREVLEEVGLDLQKMELLGRLDDVVPGSFLIKVTPFAVVAAEPAEVKINTAEIDDHVWIPLEFFFDSKNSTPYNIARVGENREVPSFVYNGRHIVWGLTLRIIQNFGEKIAKSG